MKKRFFVLLFAAAMIFSLAACDADEVIDQIPSDVIEQLTVTATPTPTAVPADPTATPTPTPAVEAAAESSLDFEDGAFAFAKVVNGSLKADGSMLSVVDTNGSKALLVENITGKEEGYLALDLSTLLGDEIAKVAQIKFDISVYVAEGQKFNPACGYVATYTGEDSKEMTKAGKWALYFERMNPKTVTIDVDADHPFVAGATNYITIVKAGTGNVAQSFAVDNIRFLDAAGNLIKADSSVSIAANSPLNETGEVEEIYGFRTVLNIEHQGDWNTGAAIPAEFFTDVTTPVTVTLKVNILNPKDWAGFFCTDKDWAKPTADYFVGLTGDTNGQIHFQDDGAIIFDDLGLTEVSFTITADAAAKYAANGGMFFPGYNTQVISAVVSTGTLKCVNNIEHQGDWNTGVAIPAEFFEGATTPLTVTLKTNILNPKDWAGFFCTDKDWAKPTADYFVGLTGDTNGQIHFQDDGAIIFDDLGLTEVSFTITAEAAAKYAANGGMFFPGYNTQVISASVSKDILRCVNNIEHQGDWNTGVAIPAEFFEGATTPLTITLKTNILNPKDWAGFFCTDKDWAKPTADYFVGLTGDTNGQIHFQDDGAIIFDDLGLTEVSFTITADAAAKYAANGGMFFPGYNTQVISAKVSPATLACVNNIEHQGDWNTGAAIPAEFFAGATGVVNVTLKVNVLNPKDWAGFFCTDKDWAKPTADYFVGLTGDTNGQIHFQDDGAIIFDDLGLTEVSFTITADAAAKYAANGGMFFPGYNVQVISAIVTK